MKFRSGNPVWGDCGCIAIISCMLVTLCIVSSCSAVLTTPEKDALAQIFQNYPELSSVPLWATNDDGEYFGKKWTNNFDDVCMSGGYDLYGVHCSEEGHVDGLRITWGLPISSNFDAVSGLTYLTNITVPGVEKTCVLAETIVHQLPQLRAADIPYVVPTTELSHSGLTYLRASEHPNLRFSNFTNLRHLSVRKFYPSAAESLGPLKSTLESLHIDSNAGDVYFSEMDISSWPQLKRLEGLYLMQDPANPVDILNLHSDKLEYLRLGFVYGSTTNLSVSSTSLTYLALLRTFPTVLDCPNLKHLFGLHSKVTFLSTPPLEELEVDAPVNENTANFPSLAPFANSLKKVEFIRGVSNDLLCSAIGPNLEDFACHLIPVTTIPDCLLQATSLKEVTLTPHPGNLSISVLDNIPTSITSLWIQDLEPASYTKLFRFPDLQVIEVSGLAGELPSDFFERFPHLRIVILHSNALTGAIPSRGWQNLELVSLSGRITSFPGIEGTASRLRDLRLDFDTEVETVPTDEVMLAAQLNSLENLEYRFYARGLVPAFWTHLPKIEEVWMWCKLSSGPLPRSIGAPALRTLRFEDNCRSVCGPLFDFDVMTTLVDLRLTGSQVSGPFPSSWDSNLKAIGSISLQNNYLTGTIPRNWINEQTRSLNLANNPGITGPLVFPQPLDRLTYLSLSNTSISLCQGPSPNIRTQNSVHCSFDNLVCPTGLSCNGTWSWICENPIVCGGTPPVYVAPPACNISRPASPVQASPVPVQVGQSTSPIEVTVATLCLSLSLCIILMFLQ